MAAQLLGKPEDAIDSDDAERLFDVMTVHRSSARRHVIIVDDAELLHAEVLAYLRLLMSIGIEQVPQFLFVGDPSFWTGTAECGCRCAKSDHRQGGSRAADRCGKPGVCGAVAGSSGP